MKDILLNILALGAILSSILVITSKNPVISVLYLIAVFINTAGYLILLGIGFIGIAYILVYIGAVTVLILFVIMMINIKLVDILEVGREYTKNLPLALIIGFVFLYEIISIIQSSGDNTMLNVAAPGTAFLTYPLEMLTDINKLFTFISSLPSAPWATVQYSSLGIGVYTPLPLAGSITENFINNINILLNPVSLDINFINFLQIEMLGQGLYTYGAAWLIISSLILLLAMVAPIILSTPTPLPQASEGGANGA